MARRMTRSPHYAHISVFYTDFYSRYASQNDQRAVYAFLGPRIDAVMSGPRDQWKGIDPTILYFPYALQFSVPVPGQKGAHDDPASGYFSDMQSWYQSHGNYDIENAFLHRGTGGSWFGETGRHARFDPFTQSSPNRPDR